ncbi:MAG: Protein of unknown function periplasmic lipoprotein [Gemmatimonadetes bacterium]|nr:Protein of unknown function periplasmic lipoprotein [Gemmatimonadota bacterium]
MRGLWLVFTLGGPSNDSWTGSDKIQHFFASAFVQSLSYGALRTTGVSHSAALTGASLTTAAVGVGKEIHDRNIRGDFSFRDLAWDAAGAGSVTILLVRTAR